VASDLDTYTKFKEWAVSQQFKPGMKLKRKDLNKDFSQANCYFE